MGLTKTVDRESLHGAMAKYVVTIDLYDQVAAENKERNNITERRPIDARDFGDLALFLRYKPVFDDPKNGKELSEEEFKTECKKLIDAFANDDREKIFGYLDEWFKFAAEYEAPENIETEADALKYVVYVRSQQGLTVTKMAEYPDYIKSRFPDMDSMMRLQAVQQEVCMNMHKAGMIFLQNDLEISAKSKKEYDANTKEYLETFNVGRNARMASDRGSADKTTSFADAFLKATEPKKPAPEDQVSVRKFELPEWIKASKGKDLQSEISKQNAGELNSALRMCIGSGETGYGVVHAYIRDEINFLGGYRTIFIDGVSIFDLLPEPKTIEAASIKLLDALCNQTGVVSVAHVAEIDGKFEYRVDVLDVRDGNDDKEYSDKIEALEKSEEARKNLFAAEAKNLTDSLTAGKEREMQANNERVKENARNSMERREKLLRAEYGLDDPSSFKKNYKERREEIEINKKNVGAAFFMLDEVRQHYRRYHNESMKNKAILKKMFPSVIDDRDFPDLMTFTRLAKTLGVGDRDLTEAEFAEETEKALTAWSKQDHAAMKPYLDKMYDFATSYKMPTKIESVDDIMKSMMYLRIQQTVTMKLVENPWYVDMRYPTAIEKARFDAFKAEYYAIYNDVYDGTVAALGSAIGGKEYSQILQEMRNPRKDLEEDDLLDLVDQGLQSYKNSKYNYVAKVYLAEKQNRLDNTTKRPERSVYKIDMPESAMALKGLGIDAAEYENEIIGLNVGFLGIIYNHDLNDSKTLRQYGYECSGFSDISRLIFIDGESLRDIVIREKGRFNQNAAEKRLLHALVNQTGVVQFAHIYKNDENELNMELETLDVSKKGADSFNNPQYIAKLVDYELNAAHYESIRNKVCSECIENKRILDNAREQSRKQALAEENAKYAEEAVNDEADFFNLDDVFDSIEYDANGNIKEKVKRDDGLNKLFKSERGKAIREQIDKLARFSHSDVVVHQLLGKIDEVLSQEEINADAYDKLWKEVWLQTVDGLKGIAAGEQYAKPVAFAEATDMVEKFMKGTLKLYDHAPEEVKPFGGMTAENMTKALKAGVPSLEIVHYSRYLDRMNEQELNGFSNISNIEFRFRAWKRTPMEEYKNMTNARAFDEYRIMDDTLNAQGKRYATASLIEFYDMINVTARNLVDDEMYNIDANRLRSDMYKFSANLKKAILEIGVVNEQEFEKLSGKTLPLEAEIEKFGDELQKLSEKDKNLENKKEEVADEDIKNENSLLSEDDILNENNVSIDDIVNENVIDTSPKQNKNGIEREYRGMREKESDSEISNDDNYRFDNDTTYGNIIGNNKNDDLTATESDISENGFVESDVIIGDRKTNIANAVRINFNTFMAGRYVVADKNPNSAYSVVTNGEVRNLATLFGNAIPDKSEEPQYVKCNPYFVNEVTGDEVKESDDFAAKYGIKLEQADIYSVIRDFVNRNTDESMENVNKTVFEKEYKLLFGDLYMQTLHATNKLCCREGKTVTVDQMSGALRGLDKMMREVLKSSGYPEDIVKGGIKPENYKTMQNYFVDNFVPKTSSELALRTIQANSRNFNFNSTQWKAGIGFNDFTEMIRSETENLTDAPHNDEAKIRAAQMYKAMSEYNGNRSFMSKVWSWIKNGREKRAIAQFKDVAKATLHIGDREFEELAATRPNADADALKDGIEKNYQKAKPEKNLKGSMISASSKDDLSSSMQDAASERNSVIDSQSESSMRERITVNEADHKKSRSEEKRKEELKEVKAEKEKENDLKNHAPRA